MDGLIAAGILVAVLLGIAATVVVGNPFPLVLLFCGTIPVAITAKR